MMIAYLILALACGGALVVVLAGLSLAAGRADRLMGTAISRLERECKPKIIPAELEFTVVPVESFLDIPAEAHLLGSVSQANMLKTIILLGWKPERVYYYRGKAETEHVWGIVPGVVRPRMGNE